MEFVLILLCLWTLWDPWKMQSEDDAEVVTELDDDDDVDDAELDGGVDVFGQVLADDDVDDAAPDAELDDDVDVVGQVGCWQDKTLVPSRPTLTASLTFCPHLNGSVSESVPSPPFLSYNVNLTF